MSQVEERVIEKLPEEKKSLRNEYISEIRLSGGTFVCESTTFKGARY